MYNRENKQHFLFFFQPIKLIKYETTLPRSWLQLLAVSSLHVISKLFSGSKTQELNNEKIQTFFFRRPQIKVGVSSFSKKKCRSMLRLILYYKTHWIFPGHYRSVTRIFVEFPPPISRNLEGWAKISSMVNLN